MNAPKVGGVSASSIARRDLSTLAAISSLGSGRWCRSWERRGLRSSSSSSSSSTLTVESNESSESDSPGESYARPLPLAGTAAVFLPAASLRTGSLAGAPAAAFSAATLGTRCEPGSILMA